MSDNGASTTAKVACATCWFFVPAKNTKAGQCRAEPPKPWLVGVIQNPVAGAPPMFDTRTFWPMMGESDWCGRHPMFGIKLDFGKNLSTMIDQHPPLVPGTAEKEKE